MKVFEDAIHTQDEHVIVAFINTQHEFEYTIYKASDGGTFPLEKKKYSEDDFANILKAELNNFFNNYKSITIIGHDIRIISNNDGLLVKSVYLDEEIYEINQAILDGYNSGDIFIESLKLMCSWKIIR